MPVGAVVRRVRAGLDHRRHATGQHWTRGSCASTLDSLRSSGPIVGGRHVVTDPDITRSQTTDWTGRFVGATPAVVRPADHDEVAAVVRCVRHGGGSRSCRRAATPAWSAGACRLHGEVVLDLAGSTRLEPVDADAGRSPSARASTLAELQQHAARARSRVRRSTWRPATPATVGGTIATNAGGIHVLRFGGTRQQLLGVEAVLADGSTVAHLGGLEKDNTGYDLAGLLCGSEGTLGVVTAARLRLVPRYEHVVVALVGVRIDSTPRSRAPPGSGATLDCLNAAELFFADGLELVCGVLDRPRPFAARPSGLRARGGRRSRRVRPTRWRTPSRPTRDVADVAVATDAARRAELWVLPRGAHQRDQHARTTPQARRDASGRQLARFVPAVRRGRRSRRCPRPDMAVRPHRRRQHPRERQRRRARRHRRRRRRAAARRRLRRLDQRRARHRRGQEAVAAPQPVGRRRSTPSVGSRARSIPTGS